ncbi:MAG: low molecular weight protein-tyrosine-phosphatase [Pseudomonadota bacterium]
MAKFACGRLLVVCVGNICRSPVAAALLQQAMPASDVRSAGLAAVQGAGIHPLACRAAEEHGVILPEHHARRLTLEDCQWAEMILVMERTHLHALHGMAPYCRGKTFLLGAADGDIEIKDPYGQGIEAFRATHRLLVNCTDAWRKLG